MAEGSSAAERASSARQRVLPQIGRLSAFALFVVVVALGMAALSGRHDLARVHSNLEPELAQAVLVHDREAIQRILESARIRDRISEARVVDAAGEVLVSMDETAADNGTLVLRSEGALAVNDAYVGTLVLGRTGERKWTEQSATVVIALLLAGFCILVMQGMRTLERRRIHAPLKAMQEALDALAGGAWPDTAALRSASPLCQPLADRLDTARELFEGRRQSEQAISQRMARTLSAHDAAQWEWDLRSGQSDYNARFTELLGFSEDEGFAQNFNWSAAIHPDDASALKRAREKLLAQQIARSDDQVRLRVRDGTYRWFRLRAVAAHDAEGAPILLSGTIEDITRERMTLDALRESEARLFHAVRGSFDGAWDWDIEAGRYYLSPRLSEMLGLPQSMQPQTHDQLLERVHPDDLSRLQHAIDEHFLRRESYDIEYRMLHEEGHYLWVRDRGLATRSANGKVLRFSGSLTDITERKQAEQAVIALAKEKQALLDDVPVAIVYVRNDRIADCNRRCEEIFGYEQAQLIGCTMDLFFEDGRDLPRLLDRAARSAPQPYAQESTLMREDGSSLHVYVSVRQLASDSGDDETIWIFSDDTARRRALDAARREEHFSAALVRSMPGVFFLLDARGALRRWNENLQVLTGRAATELISKPALDLFPAEARHMLRRQARRAFTHRDTGFEAELLSAHGEPMAHAFSLYRIDLDGQPHLLGTGLDIRAQKEAENNVLALNQQLETRVRERTAELLNAMRELESFSYSVSHDLAAPLRGIDGFSRMIEEDYADRLDDQGRDYLRRIRAGTQRMHRLIDDLLGLARITRNEMNRQPVDLSALCQDIAAELARAEPERRAEFLISPGMRVYADANLLRICMDNLMRNAWKFTSRHASARIEIGSLRQDRELVYFVRDDGAGFDMRYATKLFGPFQRLHSVGEFSGSGIGLAIVNRIVQRHGGRIWAEAEVERGACFYFTLEPGTLTQAT
ncbi:PAS domain-containing sensor histidine kinase [Methyloversatilis thermotolerans]|uniref:PAS domain-containing sensor histidine kinase n=1 Tax=Methyloversatilis thermotolerans TaxID=1346290 RepID=UPI0003803628|nr:PAS domain S-box protein [Methyloversatilis thermotolerans]